MNDNIIIVSDDIGIRIDRYLSDKIEEMTRSSISKLIEKDLVLVNGTPVKPNYKVADGDRIEILEEEEFILQPFEMQLDIVYEDEHIVIINKPQDLVVHPGYGNIDNTLVNGLLYNGIKLGNASDPIRPGIVHRLDKDTSGLIVVAKSDEAYFELIEMFSKQEVKRYYLGIVHGITNEFGTIDKPIARNRSDRRKMDIDLYGKEAITHYKLIEYFDNFSLLDLELETGRMHQIRIHMQSIKHPVVGDLVYGHKNKYGVKTQLLHSYKLEFIHPINGKEMLIETEIPDRFKDFMNIFKGD
ncbi:MAG: RluA family pseudouridine synthase [Tissierellia bacterium]|nr:RluA family pseudouridine synthase [Tissierellia bacterium]